MADVFRDKTEQLAAALERETDRDAARQALRGFLERIIIPPGDGLLQVVGNMGEMRQARFLTTVILHAGVCVPRQYARFCGIVCGAKTRNFFDNLVRLRYVSMYDAGTTARGRAWGQATRTCIRSVETISASRQRPSSSR